MKTFVMEGRTITLVAPYNVLSGGGLQVGSIVGIAGSDALSGADVETVLEGVFTVAKATGAAWTQGALIYWDNAAKNFTTTVATNKLAGVATLAALAGDTVGNVRLNAAFIS